MCQQSRHSDDYIGRAGDRYGMRRLTDAPAGVCQRVAVGVAGGGGPHWNAAVQHVVGSADLWTIRRCGRQSG